jgi:CBS domain-containing protein
MHRKPSVCAPEDDIRHALTTIAKQRVRRLPVVDASGVLKGIISIDDVLSRTDAVFKDDTIRMLKHICERFVPKHTGRSTPE